MYSVEADGLSTWQHLIYVSYHRAIHYTITDIILVASASFLDLLILTRITWQRDMDYHMATFNLFKLPWEQFIILSNDIVNLLPHPSWIY
jgi:hypothetical protein